MNFLEICKKVASDSGTISGVAPTTVVGQTGRLLKIVSYTNDAWQDIQNARNAWKWMQAEFLKPTIANTARYTATAWSITSFADWIIDKPPVFPTSLYLTATGVTDEGPIRFAAWDVWKSMYGRGYHAPGRPSQYSVSPALEFCLGPTPSDVFSVRGEYRTGNSVLALNADTPEMPVRFHELIVRRANELLAGHDEAATAFANSKVQKEHLWWALERDQLPVPTIGSAPLA